MIKLSDVSPEDKSAILHAHTVNAVQNIANKLGVSIRTIYYWRDELKYRDLDIAHDPILQYLEKQTVS